MKKINIFRFFVAGRDQLWLGGLGASGYLSALFALLYLCLISIYGA